MADTGADPSHKRSKQTKEDKPETAAAADKKAKKAKKETAAPQEHQEVEHHVEEEMEGVPEEAKKRKRGGKAAASGAGKDVAKSDAGAKGSAAASASKDSIGSKQGFTCVPMANGRCGLLMGTRIPKDYFCTVGFGETDEGGGADPYETGSYDLALEDAGIENFNIVQYTSVIPPEANEIAQSVAREKFHHGSVMEVIMARMDGQYGDRISAGVGKMQVKRRDNGALVGGYAAEYKGHGTKEVVKKILREDLLGLFSRRFSEEEHEMCHEEYIIKVGEVEKGFGTVLASICFVNYIIPLDEE